MDIQTILAIAAKHKSPETEIQMLLNDGRWVDDVSTIENIIQSANDVNFKFRIKPQTITLNGEELPKPIKPFNFKANKMTVDDYSLQFSRTYHKTMEDAQAWADALNKLMGY